MMYCEYSTWGRSHKTFLEYLYSLFCVSQTILLLYDFLSQCFESIQLTKRVSNITPKMFYEINPRYRVHNTSYSLKLMNGHHKLECQTTQTRIAYQRQTLQLIVRIRKLGRKLSVVKVAHGPYLQNGATTLGIMTFSITTLSITTLSITTLQLC